MLLFVGFRVIHRYWPLVVSFAPPCKQGYLLHLVAIVTFCCTAQNTFVLRVFCVVQPKCHTDNVAWLLDLSGTAQEEILLPIRVGKFGSCLNSASWEVSTSLLSHDCEVCFHMLCYLYANVAWFSGTAQMETRLPICMGTVISHWGKIRIFHKEQLKDGYITPHKTKLTSAQKDWQISIFLLWCASTMLF